MTKEVSPKTEAEIAKKRYEYYLASYPHMGQDLNYDTDLMNNWFVDSLGIVQTVQFLEETFPISITRADVNAANFYSIKTLAAFVMKKLR